jgi:hypothetical protein
MPAGIRDVQSFVLPLARASTQPEFSRVGHVVSLTAWRFTSLRRAGHSTLAMKPRGQHRTILMLVHWRGSFIRQFHIGPDVIGADLFPSDLLVGLLGSRRGAQQVDFEKFGLEKIVRQPRDGMRRRRFHRRVHRADQDHHHHGLRQSSRCSRQCLSVDVVLPKERHSPEDHWLHAYCQTDRRTVHLALGALTASGLHGASPSWSGLLSCSDAV